MKKSFLRSVNNIGGDINGNVETIGLATVAYVDSLVIDQDRFTLIGNVVQTGNVMSIAPLEFAWRLSQVGYTNSAAFSTTIAAATGGFARIDIIVANNANFYTKVEGVESADVAKKPDVPVGTLEVTFVAIDGSVISAPSPTGNEDKYVRKAEMAFNKVVGSGNKAAVTVVNDTANYNFVSASSVSSLTVSTANAKKFIYEGKDHYLKNENGGTFQVNHNAGTGNFKYFIPNGLPLVIQNNEIAHFKWRFTNGNNGFLDYVGAIKSGGGGIASVTGTAVNNTDPLNPVISFTETLQNLQSVTDVGATTTKHVTVNDLTITQLSNNLITPVFQAVYTDTYNGSSSTYYRLPIDSSGDMYWNRPESNTLKIIGINGSVTSVAVGAVGASIRALVLDPVNNDLYIASINGEVYLRTKAGILTLFATCPSTSLRDMVRDATGNFFVIEYSASIPRIFQITPAGVVTTFTSTVLNANAVWLGIDLNNNLYTVGVGANIKKITPAAVFSDILIPNNPNFNTLCPVCDTLGDGSMYFGNSYATGEIYKITPAGVGSVFFDTSAALGTTNVSIYNRKLYVSSIVNFSGMLVIDLDTGQQIADLALNGNSAGTALRVNPVDGNLYYTAVDNKTLMRIARSYSKLLTVNAVGDVYGENNLTIDALGTLFAPNATIGEINFDETGKALITKEYIKNTLLNKFRQQKVITHSTYAILPSDLYSTLFFNRSSAITVTINGLPIYFECDFYNYGTGTVTFVSNVGLLVSPNGLNLLTNKAGSLKRMADYSAHILSGGLS